MQPTDTQLQVEQITNKLFTEVNSPEMGQFSNRLLEFMEEIMSQGVHCLNLLNFMPLPERVFLMKRFILFPMDLGR
jgi:hypothetical protein